MTDATDLNSFFHSDDFQELSRRSGSLNVFEAAGIFRQEVRHSNILATLLDPHGTHQIGDAFLRAFFQASRDERLTRLDSLESVVVLREKD